MLANIAFDVLRHLPSRAISIYTALLPSALVCHLAEHSGTAPNPLRCGHYPCEKGLMTGIAIIEVTDHVLSHSMTRLRHPKPQARIEAEEPIV